MSKITESDRHKIVFNRTISPWHVSEWCSVSVKKIKMKKEKTGQVEDNRSSPSDWDCLCCNSLHLMVVLPCTNFFDTIGFHIFINWFIGFTHLSYYFVDLGLGSFSYSSSPMSLIDSPLPMDFHNPLSFKMKSHPVLKNHLFPLALTNVAYQRPLKR